MVLKLANKVSEKVRFITQTTLQDLRFLDTHHTMEYGKSEQGYKTVTTTMNPLCTCTHCH